MDKPAEDARPSAGEPAASEETGSVHEIRPVDNLRICPVCLVSNSVSDRFCIACGAALPATADGEAAEGTQVLEPWPARPPEPAAPLIPPDTTTAFASPAASNEAPVPAPAGQRRSRKLVVIAAALVVALVGAAVFAVLWQSQTRHAQHLAATLASTRSTLASTQADLARTRARLAAASSLSEKRRTVLMQAQDVLARVDPLLSSVDGIQGKAEALGTQGSTIAGDAEAFINTVADLVNYLIQTNPAYIDGSYVSQAIDNANAELAAIRADEVALGGDNSAYSTVSSVFETKATSFTHSVRILQKQLSQATAK